MIKITCALLLLLAAVSAKQNDFSPSSSNAVKNDQELSNDQVTSILVHPGPDGPHHVILSNDHQVISSSVEGISSRAVASDYKYHQTIPPPLTQFTYGPARPVGFYRARPSQQTQQLYHHRFRQGGKIPHLKEPQEEAIYKYSTYIKHDKVKGIQKDVEKGYYSSQSEKPDYTVTAERESHEKPQHESLSKYRNRDEKEEIQFRESIGDLYNNNGFDKSSSEYSDKLQSPQPYSKYYLKQQNYIPNNVNFAPVKYQSSYNTFDSNTYNNAPSGFDDTNGGKVLPVLAKFYKQPLPIIQTQLPADNVGLFVHYYQPQTSEYEREELSNNFFEQYPQGKLSLQRDSSNSEWTPINAPDGAVPAKAYDIPAPDLSLGKPDDRQAYRRGSDVPGVVVGKPDDRQVYRRGSDEPGVVVGKPEARQVYRRGSDEPGVVVMGKSKQQISSSHQIQGKSEGVVSAVVRVKQ